MRSPNGPLFKRYEIVAIVAFLALAALVTGFRLVYSPGVRERPWTAMRRVRSPVRAVNGPRFPKAVLVCYRAGSIGHFPS
jgi:hypothetical protein